MKQTIPLIPLWKWMLELVLGSILFAILYGLGMSLQSIPRPTAECAAIFFSAAVILAMFPLWIKLFEKQWRWDLLSRHAWKKIFCGISTGFLFFVVLSGILYVTGCYSAQYASPHWSFILVNLSFYFLVACGEEVIFRGIIFRMIDDRFGLWWALGISALIFGFAHMINPSASIWSSVAIAIEPESCWELHTNTQIRYGFLSASTGHGTSHKETYSDSPYRAETLRNQS